MEGIGLGLDTGGTFTDAVLLDLGSGRLLGRAKSPTTMEDLSVGIAGALSKLDTDILRRAGIVCLSTTLATNSVVEGRGCRTALVVMGRPLSVATPADHSIQVRGSFRPGGHEEEPLDEDSVRTFLESLKGRVDAVAVSGYLSIRNPEHEVRVREMARTVLGVPAVCGHELSSSLGFNERTVTCVMNARLIPVIGVLLDSVRRVLDGLGVSAPLLILKGDGSVMDESLARERPVETILSGPASSIAGAKRLSGLDDAVVVDIGGTTTDIGVIRGGKTRLEEEGASIGGYRTRVAAADVETVGLGGDSRIVVNGWDVSLSRTKVIPLCAAASRFPEIVGWLRELVSKCPRDIDYANYERNVVMDTEYFIRSGDGSTEGLSDLDLRFLDFVDGMPHSMADAQWELGEPAVSFRIREMEDRRLIARIGLTPTDLMHVRGTFGMYEAEASRLAVEYHASNLRMEPKGFVEKVDEMVRARAGAAIIGKLLSDRRDAVPLEGAAVDMVSEAAGPGGDADMDIRVKLKVPIVGLGGPARDMLPAVAERLGTELVLPDDHEVGNAIGAVSGKVRESIEMLIQSALGKELTTDACIVFSRLGRWYFTSFDRGLEEARAKGSEYVRMMAERAGATDVEVEEEFDRTVTAVGKGRFRSDATEVRLRLTAVGDPRPGEGKKRSGKVTLP